MGYLIRVFFIFLGEITGATDFGLYNTFIVVSNFIWRLNGQWNQEKQHSYNFTVNVKLTM